MQRLGACLHRARISTIGRRDPWLLDASCVSTRQIAQVRNEPAFRRIIGDQPLEERVLLAFTSNIDGMQSDLVGAEGL